MTENEAISYFRMATDEVGNEEFSDIYKEMCKLAIQALEEIQAYRAIGTVEEFKALKEKNEPKKIKPIHVRYNVKGTGRQYHSIYCGNCGAYSTRVYLGDKHCRRCGSAIDWE